MRAIFHSGIPFKSWQTATGSVALLLPRSEACGLKFNDGAFFRSDLA